MRLYSLHCRREDSMDVWPAVIPTSSLRRAIFPEQDLISTEEPAARSESQRKTPHEYILPAPMPCDALLRGKSGYLASGVLKKEKKERRFFPTRCDGTAFCEETLGVLRFHG